MPAVIKSNPMPRPGPTPMTRPTLPASAPPSARSGSNTRSVKGPAQSAARGMADQAIMPLTAKTRPCTAGATLLCQSDWLVPVMTEVANR